MLNPLRIRGASREDAPAILHLWQESARWLLSKGIRQWNPDWFKLEQIMEFMDQGAEIYLAEQDREVVGTYLLVWSDPKIWGELDNSDSGYIHRFAVNRNYVGQGIGGKLIESAEEQIRRKGKSIARLDCMAANDRLNQYYRDLGFTFVRRLDREGWSANLYEKREGDMLEMKE